MGKNRTHQSYSEAFAAALATQATIYALLLIAFLCGWAVLSQAHADQVASVPFVQASTKMWNELAGKQPVSKDQIGQFVTDLKPQLRVTGSPSHLALPKALTSVTFAKGQFDGLPDTVDYPIFGTFQDNDGNVYYTEYGQLSSQFTDDLTSLLSGNNPGLLRYQNPVHTPGIPIVPLWGWLGAIGFGDLAGLAIADILASDEDKKHARRLRFPPADNYHKAIIYTHPSLWVFYPLAIVKHGAMLRRGTKAVQVEDAKLRAMAPNLHAELVKAREIHKALMNKSPAARGTEEVRLAITAVEQNMRRILDWPLEVERDKARVEAANIMEDLLGMKTRIDIHTEAHRELMAAHHDPNIKQLTASTKESLKPPGCQHGYGPNACPYGCQ